MKKWCDPFGFAVFCDDIREEVGGKYSFIGVYGADMILKNQPPVLIPKLCLAVFYDMDLNDTSREDVEVQITMPGADEPAVKMAVLVSSGFDTLENERAVTDEDVVRFRANIIISPLRITDLGLIKVRAVRSDMEVKLGSLLVKCVENGKPENSINTQE